MINRLVVNGCSYIYNYHAGGGTADLATRLNILNYQNLSEAGSCNNRIIRTTLRDIYHATQPTLYVLGMTFVNRYELTVLNECNEDGTWVSFSGGQQTQWDPLYRNEITLNDINAYDKSFVNIMMSSDLLEDLMLRLVSLIDTAHSNNHRILIYNTAESIVNFFSEQPRFKLFKTRKEIVNEYTWKSVPWQLQQGAKHPPEDVIFPKNCRHISPGEHQWLNNFLTEYIQEYKILQ